jgi:predicted ATPase
MIKSIHFQNFKALRDATLPLGPFTLLVGPNGSGKSTAIQAFKFAMHPGGHEFDKVVTAGLEQSPAVEISIHWDAPQFVTKAGLRRFGNTIQAFGPEHHSLPGDTRGMSLGRSAIEALNGFRVFSFSAEAIASPVTTQPNAELFPNGGNLAAVLDALTDSEPERFEALNLELQRWLPEFDRILFETPGAGQKGFLLRTTVGHHRYRASDLSHGTLVALALLTIAYLPTPPPIVCFEEPDRGIHPRLLREVRDGMYRLAFPENYGEKRSPVQVIATTHSPYLLDLYKDHPEEVVIAHKDDEGVHFERLSEKPNISEVLEGAPLGDVWYSGILGGVPTL